MRGGVEKFVTGAIVIVQILLVFFAQKATRVSMDGIFSYTLSNNPYTYLFIDDIYDEFPQNNGWLDAHILKENYVVEEYDRFNYAAVYHHQRHDVHPPLYYFAVHTISSLFPGRYSNLFAMGINLLALLLSDMLLIKICGLLYGSVGYGLVPVAFLTAMTSMRSLLTWPRMYMMLFLFCVWYVYIHARFAMEGWKKTDFVQMAVCIFFGTLTHYYFYVYAGALSVLTVFYLLRRRRRQTLLRYLYCGIVGIAVSWIFYPWVLWHIFINEQNKHADLEPWCLEKGKEYLLMFRGRLFNDRGWSWVFLLLLWGLGMFALKRNKAGEEPGEKLSFRRMVMGSGLIYSLLVYTLDGDNWYYLTALYAAFIVWASMVLLDLAGNIKLPRAQKGVRIVAAVLCVGILYSGTPVKYYLQKAADVVKCMYNGQPLETDFRQISEKYANYNCLYIEEKRDNLFHNYYFEFGDYRLFKKMSLEAFMEHGIRPEDWAGCEQEGEGVVVYAPQECEFDEENYRWLAEDSSYAIYEYVGGRD